VNLDGRADLAVTLRDGIGNDQLLVYPGAGTGTVSTVPSIHVAPAGHELTGGLEVRDLDGDVDGDLVTTSVGPSGMGHLLIYRNMAGVLVPEVHAMGATWTEIRSLDVAELTGDSLKDVAIGTRKGKLYIARAQPGGTYVPQAINPSATAVGGGALRIADLNGDRDLDIVTSSTVSNGTLDQAFVRALLGAGNATWAVKTMAGLSSVGPAGALRPAVGDMNGDGAWPWSATLSRTSALRSKESRW
jgi:hypothetical protein